MGQLSIGVLHYVIQAPIHVEGGLIDLWSEVKVFLILWLNEDLLLLLCAMSKFSVQGHISVIRLLQINLSKLDDFPRSRIDFWDKIVSLFWLTKTLVLHPFDFLLLVLYLVFHKLLDSPWLVVF